jgi:hypothetical protein
MFAVHDSQRPKTRSGTAGKDDAFLTDIHLSKALRSEECYSALVRPFHSSMTNPHISIVKFACWLGVHCEPISLVRRFNMIGIVTPGIVQSDDPFILAASILYSSNENGIASHTRILAKKRFSDVTVPFTDLPDDHPNIGSTGRREHCKSRRNATAPCSNLGT